MTRTIISIFRRYAFTSAAAAAAVVLVFGGVGAPPAYGQSCTSTWTGGGGDSNWSNGANWNPMGEPGSSSSVCIQLPSATVNMDVSDTISNLTLGTTNSLTLPAGSGNLMLVGSSINNSGQLFIPGSTNSPATLYIGSAATVTLSGGGTVLMSDSNNSDIRGFGPGPNTLFNDETIEGAGTIEDGVTVNNNSTGVINANVSGASLTMGREGTQTNSGLMEATNGGQLIYGSGTLINIGGTIQAVGAGSSVAFSALGAGGQTITGGTLATSGGGIIYSEQSTLVDGSNGNTVTNTGSIVVPDAGNHPGTSFQGTFNNTGSIQVLSAGVDVVDISIPNGQTWTAMGSGSITLGDGTNNTYNNNVGITGGTLVNQQLLQGTGTIENLTGFTNNGTVNDNVPVGSANLALVISRLGSFTNTGTLEATNGGALDLELQSLTNTGGMISASGANSYVNTSGSTITGGTFTTSSGGTIYADQNGGTASTLTGITNRGAMVIQDNNTAFFSGTVTNTGAITVDSTGDTTTVEIPVGATLTLTGSGSVTLTNFSQSTITNQCSGSATLINQSTIQGSGTIFTNTNCSGVMTNSGTLLANQSVPLNIVAAIFTNTGTLKVSSGSTMNLPSSASNFTNLVSGTLTGGKYLVTGTLTIPGNITTNDAGITLTGTASQILNPNTNALAGFLTNGNKGSFTLSGNQNFTAPGAFTNQGVVTISRGSTFTVAGSGSYTQTGGKTIVSGTLGFSTSPSFPGGDVFFPAAGSANVQKGSLFGAGGRVGGNLKMAGSVTPGNSSTTTGILAVAGTYTQTVSGALNSNIGGTTVGTQYGQLSSTGAATLAGTLNIALINNFVPAVGNTFVILKASNVTGTFATVNGTSINSNEHFQVTYNSNNVTLQVVAGP